MECGEAARGKDGGGHLVSFELEAAEALAGLARISSSAELKRPEAVVAASASQSQDQAIVAEPVCDNGPTVIACPQMSEKAFESSPSQLCRTCSHSKPEIKLRRKLTEAEKQERKVRRILANRESARETIRRRQAMYLELTRKASDVVEENDNLKKKKELAVEEYNSLKGRNEFLKEQLVEAKKAAAGETGEDPITSNADKPCSATTTPTPMFLHNQPSMFPCFWPSILPPSDVFSFRCPSNPHNTNSSQFPVPPRDTSCPHQGQEHSMGTPLFVVPVPWLLPLLSHSSTNDKTNTHHCSKCSCSDSQPHEDKNQCLPNQNTKTEEAHPITTKTMVVPGLFSPVKPIGTPGPPHSCQVDIIPDVNDVSTPESDLSQRNEAPVIRRKPQDMFAASAARRRRKELLKLKNVHFHDVRSHY